MTNVKPPVPPAAADLIRELARRTKLGTQVWRAAPDEAWKIEPVGPPGTLYADVLYAPATLTTFLDCGSIEINMHQGGRGAPAVTVRIWNEFDIEVEHIQIDAIWDDEGLYMPLQDTFKAALVQVQAQEAATATDLFRQMLDGLHDEGSH